MTETNTQAGDFSPVVKLQKIKGGEDWTVPHLVGETDEYSALLELQKKAGGTERLTGNSI